jgi:hypothetical protein
MGKGRGCWQREFGGWLESDFVVGGVKPTDE